MKIFKCAVCGRELSGKEVIFADEYTVCEDCNNFYGTCATCANRNKCEFETAKDNTPKTIQKRYINPMGGGVGIIETINMDRVKKFCPGCACFINLDNGDSAFCSRRNFNTCNNYKFEV